MYNGRKFDVQARACTSALTSFTGGRIREKNPPPGKNFESGSDSQESLPNSKFFLGGGICRKFEIFPRGADFLANLPAGRGQIRGKSTRENHWGPGFKNEEKIIFSCQRWSELVGAG